jgi:DNA-binding MarR family transcriptional regulator
MDYICSKTMIIQRLYTELGTLDKALIYYEIISIVNNLNLSRRDIQIMAYTNKRGTISSITAKKQFISIFGSTISTVNNTVTKLRKLGLLTKVNGKTVINPKLSIDFSKPVTIALTMNNEKESE